MLLRVFFIYFVCNFFILKNINAKEHKVLLGILEKKTNEKFEKLYKDNFYARVSFKKIKGKWEPFISLDKKINNQNIKNFHLYYPEKISWHIFYKGEIIGDLISIRFPYPFFKKQIFEESKILNTGFIGLQKIKDKKEDIEKYFEREENKIQHFVLSTQKNTKNKQIIKPYTLNSKEIKKIINFIHKQMVTE